MKRRTRMGLCGGIIATGWLLTGALAVADDGASTQPAVVRDDAYWKGLEERLGAEDFQVREAATKELDQVGWKSEAKLRELMGKTSDEQVKASLEARIEGISEELATNPPPISVDLHDARLSDVASALKQATGIPLTTWSGDDNGRGPTYTLTMKDKPFWEVFAALSRQHPLMVQRSDRLQVMQSEPGMRNVVAATGGFFVFPGPITRSRMVDLQADPGKQVGEETLVMEYKLAADPRVKIVSQSPPTLTDVRDEAGNELLAGPVMRAGRRRNFMVQWQEGSPLFQAASSLKIVENMGKKIVSAKGQAVFQVAISEDVVNVEKPEEKLKQDLAVGSQTITIEKFEVKPQQILFSIQAKGGDQRALGMARRTPLPTRVQVFDKSNQMVWDSRLYGGTSGSIGVGDDAGPFHLRFSAVTRTKEVAVEFELKDLPIP